MDALLSNVLVAPHTSPDRSVHGVEVHHRDFPELRAVGDTAEEAAARLCQEFCYELEAAGSAYRREAIEKAIAEIREFLGKG